MAELYELATLVELTGWSIEYIESLGLLHREALLQKHDAVQRLKSARRRGR